MRAFVPAFSLAGRVDLFEVVDHRRGRSEAGRHLHRSLGAVRESGARAGVALNPATPLAAVEHVLDLVDLLLVMTVNPGFGGQVYVSSMEPKIAAARRLLDQRVAHVELEVDGGICATTVGAAVAAGARTLCIGSALFADRDDLVGGVSRRRLAREAIC